MLAQSILVFAQVRPQPQPQTIPDFFTFSAWIMTAISVTITLFQIRRTKKMTQRSKEELLGFIERTNYVNFELELINEITKKRSDPTILRHLTSSHQAGSDLYRNLVNYYLSLERSFTYVDLKKICKTPIISYKWQEDCWRTFICLREENRDKEIPTEHYLDESEFRTQYYRERGIEPPQNNS
jgi:hypothetical protein